MPAWRLGRTVGSLLLLAVLAVGGYAAHTSSFHVSQVGQAGVVADTDAPAPEVPVSDPATSFATLGFDWD